MLIVATENDSLYALDADTSAQLWKVALLRTGETASDDRGCSQVTPQIGITSTPVIGLKAGTSQGAIFAVSMSKDASGKYHQRLHKVSLATGKPLTGAAAIAAKYTGTGEDSQDRYAFFKLSSIPTVRTIGTLVAERSRVPGMGIALRFSSVYRLDHGLQRRDARAG